MPENPGSTVGSADAAELRKWWAEVNMPENPGSTVGSVDAAELRKWWAIVLLALLLWREARNQSDDAILAVACSVRNRMLHPGWWGHDWVSIILCHEQYSSFNPNDPNAVKEPSATDPVYMRCLAIAKAAYEGLTPDASNGADSYFDKSLDAHPPSWAAQKIHACDVGAFHFYATPQPVSA
jgi:N-acetylmuramoyl-L-alanine amidase